MAASDVLEMNLDELGEWFRLNDFTVWLDTTCVYCGGEALQTDHIIPKSRGGTNDRDNKTPSCIGCNATKGTETPNEWLGISNDDAKYGSNRHVEFAHARRGF
jgi:hypothetical protein